MKADNKLTGKVILKKVSAGSKSEHNAVCLQTDDGDIYQLRRQGGNPFYDADLQKLVGKQISATGVVADNVFIAKEITEIE